MKDLFTTGEAAEILSSQSTNDHPLLRLRPAQGLSRAGIEVPSHSPNARI